MAETMPHESAVELLPWLANGTLDQGERDAVQAHAQNCIICRRELGDLETVARLLGDAADDQSIPPADMQRINARIDALLERERCGPAVIARLKEWATNPWRVGFALQTIVLLVIASFWLMPATDEPEFTTLTTLEHLGSGHYLRVVFATNLDTDTIHALLYEQGLAVSGGPSALGVYTLKFADSIDAAGRDATLAALRTNPGVLFAQPVAGTDPR
jgi:hypothetical protein